MQAQNSPADAPAVVIDLPPTERRLEASLRLDESSSAEVLGLLNAEDRVAVEAVAAVIPQLAAVVGIAAERFRAGGRIHYVGAGTSGRLGVLDAAELLPTFNLEPGRVIAHIAGGAEALVRAVEDAEDSEADGEEAVAQAGSADVVLGLAASGRTPYVKAALESARSRGAYTVLVSSNPDSPLASLVDENIVLETGAEVLTGSTRLKAATAQKLLLNGFSTALMVELGRTWSNLMVWVVATNAKLRRRTVRILQDATGMDEKSALSLLEAADGELQTAIVSAVGNLDITTARRLLTNSAGSVRDALTSAPTPD